MSSFTIDKIEYIKAAGLMYGLESAKRDSHQYFLSVVYYKFVRCYELNLASVNEQYNDNEQPDTEEYKDIFEGYKKIGEKLYLSALRRRLSNSLWHFFRSALYQTENVKMAMEIRSWFFFCVSLLYEKDIKDSADWWREINIEELIKQEETV